MIKPISAMDPYMCDTMHKLGVEQDRGWRSGLSISEINRLLESQKPFTYIISPLAPDIYLLSFVRENDQGVVHIQFDRLQNGTWHYVNGSDNILPTLKGIIRKMMHLADPISDPIPLV